MSVRNMIEEVKAIARGSGAPMTKQASPTDLFSPEQLLALADRIEKAGATHEASERIVEMRRQNQASPSFTDLELRKLAHREALRQLGFKEGKITPVNLFFGDMQEAQTRLSKWAAESATHLIQQTIKMALSDEEGSP